MPPRLQLGPAQLVVRTSDHAQITVDGKPVDSASQHPVGTHRVAIVARGRLPVVREIELAAGSVTELDVALVATPRRRAARWTLYGAAGLGGAALVTTGLAFLAQHDALSIKKEGGGIDAYTQELHLVFDQHWFMVAESAEKETAAVAITVPDVNQVLAKMDGRLLPLGWWHFLRKGKTIDRVRVGFLGVKPQFQHTGVAAKMYVEHFDMASVTPQKWGEMGWILETNTNMNRAMEAMGMRDGMRATAELNALGFHQRSSREYHKRFAEGVTAALDARDAQFEDYRTSRGAPQGGGEAGETSGQ